MRTEQALPPREPFIHRFLAGLIALAGRFPRLVLALALLLSTLSVHAFCTRLTFHTQRNDLLSPDKDYQRRWKQYLAEFGDDDDVVVVVQGANRRRMQEAIDAVASELQHHPGLF